MNIRNILLYFMQIGLLSINLSASNVPCMILPSSASQELLSICKTCISSFAATNNSYVMSSNEQLASLVNAIDDGTTFERLLMYVPKLQPGQNVTSLDSLNYEEVVSDQIPVDDNVVDKINSFLIPTKTTPGQAVTLIYTIQPITQGSNNHYNFILTILASNENAPVHMSTPKKLTGTIGSITYSYPSKVNLQDSSLGSYTVPAVPFSLALEFTTNQSTSGLKKGHICFTPSVVSSNSQEQLYTASFTFYPAPYVAPTENSNVKNPSQPAKDIQKKQSVVDKKEVVAAKKARTITKSQKADVKADVKKTKNIDYDKKNKTNMHKKDLLR